LGTAAAHRAKPMRFSTAEHARRFGVTTSFVAPPYDVLLPIDATLEMPPLGALVVSVSDNTLAALATLTGVVHRWPWVVPCLGLPPPQAELEPLLMLVSELRDHVAFIRTREGGPGRPEAVLAAVRRRPSPGSALLARWLGVRVRNRELVAAAAHQFETALEGVPAETWASPSTFSRLFGRYGPYTARDWRALARLCLGTSQGLLAARLRSRRASRYARRYLGVSLDAMTSWAGWEWVMEAALRRGGYLDRG
jgi:hypothetical protein